MDSLHCGSYSESIQTQKETLCVPQEIEIAVFPSLGFMGSAEPQTHGTQFGVAWVYATGGHVLVRALGSGR